MYELCNSLEQRRVLFDIMRMLVIRVVVLPLVLSLGLAALVGGLAALSGLDPVDFALRFLGEATVTLSEPLSSLWAVCFLAVAICFGAGRNLSCLMQTPSLPADIVPRLAQLIAIWTRALTGIGDHLYGLRHWPLLVICPSRIATSTSSDLAGATPRLE